MRHAGIIAAGHGSRLKGARPAGVKPLVEVGGKPLVDWVALNLRACGIDAITILLNSAGDPVREHLENRPAGVQWTFLRADTASSWESFRLVSRELSRRTDRFIISTVDALIPPRDMALFARSVFEPASRPADLEPLAALGLAPFGEGDDEKPLWAKHSGGYVTALGRGAAGSGTVTAGLYALTRSTAQSMPAAAAHQRLRDYWIDLIDSGQPVQGVPLSGGIDVDRLEDLDRAEKVTACFEP